MRNNLQNYGSNMGYCRFANTLNDLQDCHEHIEDDISDEEKEHRYCLIELCKTIVDEYGEDNNLD